MDSSGTNAVNEGGSQQYTPHPSQVPVSNFVSIKLCGETNYNRWKKQMMCLLEYHDMVGFIDGTIRNPNDVYEDDDDDGNKVEMTTKFKEWNKSKDTLVKGWIFGTLSDDVFDTVLDLHNAYTVWEKLKISYDNSLRVEGAKLLTEEEIIENEKVEAEYIPLHRAIIRGDWDTAQEFFNRDTATLTAKISAEGDSALHIAIGTCHNIHFVEKLLKEISPESLLSLVSDNHGLNVLHSAAIVGNTKAAKMLVEKNPYLLFTGDKLGYLPILRASINNRNKTVLYLLEACKIHIDLSQVDGYHNPFEGAHGSWILYEMIMTGLLDIAYELINEHPNLAIAEDNQDITSPLMSIVNQRDQYYSAARYNSYQRFVYSHVPIGNTIDNTDNMIPDIENPVTYNTKFVSECKRSYYYTVIRRIYVNIWKAALLHVPHIKRLREDKLKHTKGMMILERICEEIGKINNATEIYRHICAAFNKAVLNDTPEVVETIVRLFPHAIWTRNDDLYLSQVIARYRCEMVCNYLEDQVNRSNDRIWATVNFKDGNNMLHLAGLLAPIENLNVVSGAALQIQKELQWFKKIEKFVLPGDKKWRNKNGDTPIMVFREEHKQLRKEAEEWMKKTSDSYTITAALIITVVFAAAITVPGGNDQNTGKPIYETKARFIIFAVSDAISLFTSTTSLLLFLSILTARYHEDDFLYKLPKRLIFGLVMLFLSVTSMMVAFSATLYIMFGQGKAWILIPIAALACLPIATYVMLQFPLLVELISSTYGREIYSKRSDSRNK